MGYPFAISNAISNTQTYGSSSNASTIVFSSDFSELWVGLWQDLAVSSSSEASYTTDGGTTWISSYQANQTLIKTIMWADMAIRRPAAFVIASGILP